MSSDHPGAKRTPARSFGLSHDDWGRLVLIDADGRRFVGVEPVRTFPISHPTRWIAVCDAQGREILSLDTLDDVSPAVRKILEDELSAREFVPILQRIISVSGESFPCDWEVITDRGPITFTIENEEDIRQIGPYRIMITDTRKLRYHVPDVRALDSRSRRLFERFL